MEALKQYTPLRRRASSVSREEVQQVVRNLESPLLQNSTLGDALRTIAGNISSGAIAVEVSASVEPPALSPATRHHLPRIAQEAITNAVKHAQASRRRVARNPPGVAVLEVTEDGRHSLMPRIPGIDQRDAIRAIDRLSSGPFERSPRRPKCLWASETAWRSKPRTRRVR